MAAIIDGLAENADQVLMTGIPPFTEFPSLPETLGRYLSERATALDEVARQLCADRPSAIWIDSTALFSVVTPEFFAKDHFHPSALGYREWARAIAEHVDL